jgi:hypothetical protein
MRVAGTNVVTLAPAPVDELTALERLRGAVVTANPLSPLFHRRDVVPVFAKPAAPPASSPDALWPGEDYSIRQGTGVFRKKTRVIATRLAALPRLPLPLPDRKPGAVRTLQPDIAIGGWWSGWRVVARACGSDGVGVFGRPSPIPWLVCLFVSVC